MKFSTTYALAGALVPMAQAFPYKMLEELYHSDSDVRARADEILATRQVSADAATAIFEPVPIFNAKEQFVDVSEGSGHEWVAPGPDDLRGPCPGLNAMANHNFLPHDGYGSLLDYVHATNSVVGMGVELATFLSAFGSAIDGSGTAWSLGGTPTAAQAGVLGGVTGGGNGISGSHNKYESDVSPTRPDLYEYGNDYKLRIPQFQALVDASQADGSVTMNSLTEFRSQRFDQSISGNPYFFNGPFTGVLVQPAAYTFIYRFMANHSDEHPYGLLDFDVLKSWFAVEGESGSYTVNQGYERIPENWYKRAIAYPYSTEYFLADFANAAALHPKFLDIGGNMGEVNTFTGVNVNNLTGGVYNAQDLAQGNNAACLAFQASTQVKPDLAVGLINQLTNTLGDISSKLSCPQLEKIDEEQLMQFPGYKRSDVSLANDL